MLQSMSTIMALGARVIAAGLRRPATRHRRVALGIALCALLASCDDGYDHVGICYSCDNITPQEISKGVVSADFNGDGFADVVALSSIHPGGAPGSSNLK